MSKHTLAAAAALALAAMLSMPAYSQEQGHHHDDRGPMRGEHRGDEHMRGPGHHENRDEWQRHEWHRGERVPPEYRNRQYVVEDWRGHGLNRPPRGYQWVQVPGGDYALISMRSGVISNIVIGH
jgi:Ni/Co efflux regulator RcnB